MRAVWQRAEPSFRLVGAVAIAVVTILVLLVAVGADPGRTAAAMARSTFGSLRNFGETLVRATPLLIIGLTLLPSLRAGLFNIGAPGQMGIGALAATAVALSLTGHGPWLVLPLCAVSAGLAGGLTALAPGYLKTRWAVNEIVSTLAVNFIVVALLGYLLNGPMQGDFANLPQSDPLPPDSRLPSMVAGTRVHIGLVLALLVVPLLLLLDRSPVGYRLRLFSANRTLAQRALVDPKRYVLWMFVLAGAGAGLAGWMQVAAIDGRLYPSIATPVGYAGLFVALLGGLHPVGMVVAALCFGILLHGGGSLQVGAGISPEIVQVFLGIILFAYAVRPSLGKR